MAKKIDTVLSAALVYKGLISQKEIEPFIQQADSSGTSLQQLLIKHGRLSEKDILNVLLPKKRY